MADGNGRALSEGKALALADVERINDCAHKAKSIVMLIRYSVPVRSDWPEEAITGACWAAEGLIEEMERIATEKEHGNG